MFILSKTFKFEASHQLMHHDGKCAHLHGHSWVLTVRVKTDVIHSVGPKKNMVIDYGTISDVVEPVVRDMLDHHHLNETFDNDSPTSELLAIRLFALLESKLPNLHSVVIQETESSSAEFGHVL